MRVTRITIDADLGLIELKTGSGGDGDYVLLPIAIPEEYERFIAFDRPARVDEGPRETNPEENRMPWYSGDGESPDEARGGIVASGGWSTPKDQAHDYNATPGVKAYQADLDDPPQCERGGIKYPGAGNFDRPSTFPIDEPTGTATVEEVADAMGLTLCQFCKHMKEPNA